MILRLYKYLLLIINLPIQFTFNVLKIFQGHSGGPMMSQASVEEDGVSWIEQGNLLAGH